MSDNLQIYNKVRKVPEEAQKPIKGGRLNGKTDINPMWRIKALTEVFGTCGVGWRYTIDRQWLETGIDGEIAAYCNISLYHRTTDGWSEPIPGTGGSMYIAKESKGLYTSDECFKMALTDALSVACKALGVGADVYWDRDSTKYDKPENEDTAPKNAGKHEPPKPKQDAENAQITEDKEKLRKACNTPDKVSAALALIDKWGLKSSKDIPHSRVDEFIKELEKA